jgi:hypothetical protein
MEYNKRIHNLLCKSFEAGYTPEDEIKEEK